MELYDDEESEEHQALKLPPSPPVTLTVRPEAISPSETYQMGKLLQTDLPRCTHYASLLPRTHRPRVVTTQQKYRKYRSPVLVARDTIISKGKKGMTVGLWVESPLEGPNLTLEIEPTDAFNLYFPEIDTLETIYHQSLHRLVHTRMTNDSNQDIFLPAGTHFGEATVWRGIDVESFQLDMDAQANQ